MNGVEVTVHQNALTDTWTYEVKTTPMAFAVPASQMAGPPEALYQKLREEILSYFAQHLDLALEHAHQALSKYHYHHWTAGGNGNWLPIEDLKGWQGLHLHPGENQEPDWGSGALSLEEMKAILDQTATKMASNKMASFGYEAASYPQSGNSAVTALKKAFPGAMKLTAHCPEACDSGWKGSRLDSLIPHLNDQHRWKTAQIAEWLENTFEPKELAS